MWTLVRMRPRPGEKKESWLLIKDKDKAAGKSAKTFLDRHARSVKTGRTMDEIASAANSNVWRSKAAGTDKKAKKQPARGAGDTATLEKKYKSVELCTLVETAPEGGDWLHEIKFDGYRLLGYVHNGAVSLHTRNGNDWTEKFPDIVSSLKAWNVEDAVVDMEAVVIRPDGKTDFQKLQNIISEETELQPIHAYVFDLLHLNGEDLRKTPLIERKEKLKKIIAGPVLHYSDHIQGSGAQTFGNACKMDMEGIVCKRADSLYTGKRTRDWVKVKCVKQQEFVIIGYTDSTVSKSMIGALHLGYYKGGKLCYAGKVGTGFTQDSARSIKKTLDKLPEVNVPDIVPREARRASHWVKPSQLAEITFGMWTDDGRIRHAAFDALRSDKPAKDVVQEVPKPMPKTKTRKAKPAARAKPKKLQANDNVVMGVTISHPDRLVFEPMGIHKLDLAEYYALAAESILRDIKGHPVTLVRCPEGADHECFYQRNPALGMGPHIKPFKWKHKGKDHTYFYTDDAQGIVEMIQMGAIEIHPWGASVKNIDHPDRIIFDCDPGEDVPFEAVKLAAEDLRRRLEALGLDSFVKTTGGKGLHVRVPIAPKTPWADVKNFARALCEQMEADTPQAYLTKMTKSIRRGKIFLDFFRNDYTATAVADWAVRARPGAPVAAPLEWGDLKKLKSANAITMEDAHARLKKKVDPARYVSKQSLTKSILKSLE
jgi:bifunctional non-homologous end joining protein LigD